MEVTVLLVIIMTTTKRKHLNCKRTQYSHRLTCKCQIVGNIYSINSNSLMYITNTEEYKRNVVSPLKRCFYTCPSWLLFIEMYHLTRRISNSGPKNKILMCFFLFSLFLFCRKTMEKTNLHKVWYNSERAIHYSEIHYYHRKVTRIWAAVSGCT